MSFKIKNIEKLIRELTKIEHTILEGEKKYKDFLRPIHPKYKKSARNLVQYRLLRTIDIRKIQNKLGKLGLSRLAKAEAHIMDSLSSSIFILKQIAKKEARKTKQYLTIGSGEKIHNRHVDQLLGQITGDRRVRIMVTIPSEASENVDMVGKMIDTGMNVARINCAHDTPADWLRMIENIRNEAAKRNSPVKISMDLAGPKIRTGAIKPGPKVVEIVPKRDMYGKVKKAEKISLVPYGEALRNFEIPVAPQWLEGLESGDEIKVTEKRNKSRMLIIERTENRISALTEESCYLETGQIFHRVKDGAVSAIGDLPPRKQKIRLHINDHLILHKSPEEGEPTFMEEGRIAQAAHISCTYPAALDALEPGDRVLFDDGKIEAKVMEKKEEELVLVIIHTKPGGANLASDKGINLPNKNILKNGLTAKDREDLLFVIEHADLVNVSFVNHPDEVSDLMKMIQEKAPKPDLGIILKIETMEAFKNLTNILLSSMQFSNVGVMIARGDLAIECGWNEMGRIQREILSLCNAAHLPIIWATQVLENVAKKGIPSRSEITDATYSIRADCVMLNKGPYIHQAISLLDVILKQSEVYHYKSAPLLPNMEM